MISILYQSILLMLLFTIAGASHAVADSWPQKTTKPVSSAPEDSSPKKLDWDVRLDAEMGGLSVVSNKARFSTGGTYLEYRTDGGQDNLYFFQRYAARLYLKQKHQLTFLLQPLVIESINKLSRDLVIDGEVFSRGADVRFTYGFPFYRASYAYGVIMNERTNLYIGGSIQMRNATISFENLDGSQFVTHRDVGVVPIVKMYWEQRFVNSMWMSAEADGFYAPISYINGSDSEVVGAILDAAIRVGVPMNGFSDVFLSLRYIGGGAVGQSTKSLETGDGYVKNWLHFAALAVGFRFEPGKVFNK